MQRQAWISAATQRVRRLENDVGIVDDDWAGQHFLFYDGVLTNEFESVDWYDIGTRKTYHGTMVEVEKSILKSDMLLFSIQFVDGRIWTEESDNIALRLISTDPDWTKGSQRFPKLDV